MPRGKETGSAVSIGLEGRGSKRRRTGAGDSSGQKRGEPAHPGGGGNESRSGDAQGRRAFKRRTDWVVARLDRPGSKMARERFGKGGGQAESLGVQGA